MLLQLLVLIQWNRVVNNHTLQRRKRYFGKADIPKPEPASNIVSPGKIRSRIDFRRKSLSLPNDIALLTLSYCGIIMRNTSITSLQYTRPRPDNFEYLKD